MFKHSSIFNARRKPPKWDIFNIPLKSNIRYSIIFNETREFQKSIEKHAIEVPNWSKMSSCCFVDDSVNKQTIDVIFLDEYQCCSSLALRLFIQEQLLMKKSNNLLVFLNKFKIGATFKLQNKYIYVKCTTSLKWPLFYDMFEFLIKNLGKSVIGPQFYIHFVCKDLIHRELRFLQITKERKDLPNFIPSQNMHQIRKIEDFETTLPPRQFSKKVCSEYKSKVNDGKILAYKRKIVDNNKVDKYKIFKSSHNSSKKMCKCTENKWHYFKPLVKYVVLNYSNILEVRGTLNELETTRHSVDCSINSSSVPEAANVVVKEISFNPGSAVKKTAALSNVTKEVPLRWKPYHLAPEAIVNKNIKESVKIKDAPNNASENCVHKVSTNLKNNDILERSLKALENNQRTDCEFLSENVDDLKGVIIPENTNSAKILCEKPKYSPKDCSFMMFQTAAGKALKISEESLRIAQKMYTEVCSQVIDKTKSEEGCSFANSEEKVTHSNYGHNSGFSSASKSTLNKTCFGDNMDTGVDDRFFEEISFDENVGDCNPFNEPGQSTSISSSTSFQTQSGKVKKSLGGRRSLKPYVKKSS